MTGTELIAAERMRQIAEEGWSLDHDYDHCWEDLAEAGMSYALNATGHNGLQHWPWDTASYKPKDALRDLIRAGALIAAAIDRHQA